MNNEKNKINNCGFLIHDGFIGGVFKLGPINHWVSDLSRDYHGWYPGAERSSDTECCLEQ